ncbi:MAG: 2-oxoacid:acceptor oxidoreductase subunit alpha [Candidatus Omnitrophica bacterium]|nr:2-oxoacid:acceptor oxidoreductase subunit alpha [Candidatus Omnitrophota bacterium]
MKQNEVAFKIAGEAGQGLNVSTLNLARTFTRKGFHAFLLTDNPNSIKLEPTWCSLRVSTSLIASQTERIDVLVALKTDAVLRYQAEVSDDGFIIYDEDAVNPEGEKQLAGIKYLPVPLSRIANTMKAPDLIRNTIALGGFLALIDYHPAGMKEIIAEVFARKGEAIVNQNISALEAGFNFVQNNYGSFIRKRLPEENGPARLFLTGNDALSLGAIKAGCKLLAAYPMTPASPILHYIASKEREYQIVVKHTEDEIAAMNMVIGANFAGVRAMTCTSGGGFSLMVEALGMAAQSETPVVVVVGQRPGPSTGQPTHTGQGELQFLISASQGEFPRIIIAPGDATETFRETFNAFNLAEKFQVPVLILTDKYLAESYTDWSELKDDDLKIDRGKLLTEAQLSAEQNYLRYQITSDGISPRSIPSQQNGIHVATSYEHDESGWYQEDPAGVKKMYDKRFAKMPFILKEMKEPKLYGPDEAQITLLAWGSTKGPVLEALERLANEGIAANLVHLTYLWPLPVEALSGLIKNAQKTIMIEGNYTGQLAQVIRQETGLKIDHILTKYNGQPFYPAEICAKVKEVL